MPDDSLPPPDDHDGWGGGEIPDDSEDFARAAWAHQRHLEDLLFAESKAARLRPPPADDDATIRGEDEECAEPEADGEPDPDAPRGRHRGYLRQQLDAERARLRAHGVLLHTHPELHADLAQCRADLRTAASDRLFHYTVIWLWRCYGGLWDRLRVTYSVPDVLIVEVIKKAVQGAWHDAVSELVRTPEVLASEDGKLDKYAAITALIATLDLPETEYTSLLHEVVGVERRTMQTPGHRRAGVSTDEALLMDLYSSWQRWKETGRSTESFIRAVKEKDVRIAGWGDAPPSLEGIKRHLNKVARPWLEPRRHLVPATPRLYLEPG